MFKSLFGWLKDIWEKRKKVLVTTLSLLVDTALKPMIVDKIKEGKNSVSEEAIADDICFQIKELIKKI